jgi:hypothetical protein
MLSQARRASLGHSRRRSPGSPRAASHGRVAALTLVRYAAFVIVMQSEGRELGLPLLHLHAALWQAALDAAVAFVALRLFPSLASHDAHGR